MKTIPHVIIVNANPKGCNQWTGPDCDGSVSVGEINEPKPKNRSKQNQSGSSSNSGPLEGNPGGPSYSVKDTKRGSYGKSFDTGLVKTFPKKGISIPAVEVKKGIDTLQKVKQRYIDAGHEEMGSWFDRVISQVEKVGTEKVLEELGPKPIETKSKEKVLYQGHDFGTETNRVREYLEQNGIILSNPKKNDQSLRLVSALIKDFKPEKDKLTRKDFVPKAPKSKNKLEESQALPGLESTKDVSDLVGKPVTALTPEVTKKFDKEYGKGKWIVKAYGDDAFQSFGIFFPQRIDQLRNDARNQIWTANSNLERFGFKELRDENKVIVGVKSSLGEEYKFNSKKYKELGADLKLWADSLKEAAKEENGPSLPVKEFMVQPAFPVVGISDKDRADGEIINYGQEGRVHIVTKGGKVEAVPYATLVKGEYFPIVVDTDDTKAMVKAAIDAISSLPESERKGQIYAPDVIKTANGYKVVEANPANNVGSSGWLSWNEQIIDAYVSHLMGREPRHVQFIRQVLEDKPAVKKGMGDKYWGSKVQPFYHKEVNPSSDAAIIRENKKGEAEILLIQRSKKKANGEDNVEGGKWALPGGFHNTIAAPGETFIKSGETPRKAALRELEEETKLNLGKFVKKLQKVGVYEGGGRDPRDNKESWSQSHAFVLKLPKNFNTDSVKGSDDASKAKWVKIKDLHKMKLAFDHGKIIKDALKKAKIKMTRNHYPSVEIVDSINPIGIIANVFCATGEGGGIDPSCKGDDTGGRGSKDYPNQSKMYSDMKSSLEKKSPEELGKIAKSYGIKESPESGPKLIESIIKKQKDKDAKKNPIDISSKENETGIREGVPKERVIQELKKIPQEKINEMIKDSYKSELKVKDQVKTGLEKIAIEDPKVLEPSFTQKLASKITSLFTGDLPKNEQGGIFKSLKSSINIFNEGRSELVKEYGSVTGNAIAGAALIGKVGGGIAGGTVGFGITATLLNFLGGTFVTAFGGNVGNKTGSQRLIEAQFKTIGGGIKVGSHVGSVITSLPLIALAHSIRGIKNLTNNGLISIDEVKNEANKLPVEEILKLSQKWLEEMENKINRECSPEVEIVDNGNPRGCNQYTGPDCDGGRTDKQSKRKSKVPDAEDMFTTEEETKTTKTKSSKSKNDKIPEDFPAPISASKSSEKAWRKDMEKEMTQEQHKELYKEKEKTVPRVDLAKEAWKESMKKELTPDEWNKLYGDKPEVVVVPSKEKKHKESVDRVSDAKKFQNAYEKANRKRLFEQ